MIDTTTNAMSRQAAYCTYDARVTDCIIVVDGQGPALAWCQTCHRVTEIGGDGQAHAHGHAHGCAGAGD